MNAAWLRSKTVANTCNRRGSTSVSHGVLPTHSIDKLAIFSILVVCCLSLAAFGQEKEKPTLPEAAKGIVEKLAQFEAKTLLEAQVKIEQKRGEVIKYLEAQIDKQTRAGNLDGAMAIREEVARLKALNPPSEESLAAAKQESVEPENDVKPAEAEEPEREAVHAIVGRWTFEDKDGADMVREFTEDGKCIQYRSGRREWSLDYDIVNRREVDVVFLGALKFRHTLRGNGTLKIKEPDTIARREAPEAEGN